MLIEVGSYGNNCGLFALGLSVSLAIRTKKSSPACIPEYIRSIRPSDVQDIDHADNVRYGPRQVEISRFMRAELAKAMKANQIFKGSRIRDFIFLCLNPRYPFDLEALSNGNAHILADITTTIDHLIPVQANFQLPADVIPLPVLLPDQLAVFQTDLVTCLKSGISEKNLCELAVGRCPTNDLAAFATTCLLLRHGLDGLHDNDAGIATRNVVRGIFERWFFTKCSQLFNTESTDVQKRLRLIELGRCRALMAGTNDINHNAREVYAYVLAVSKWDQIFNNYVEYVRTRSVMLSADELNCLARAWNVEMSISIDGQKPTYASLNDNFNPELTVTITNQGVHWNVLVDDVTLIAELEEEAKAVAAVPPVPASKAFPQSSSQFFNSIKPSNTVPLGQQSKESSPPGTQVVAGHGLESTDIAILKVQLAQINQQKLMDVEQRRALLRKKLIENDQQLASKVETVAARMKKQQTAIDTEYQLQQEERSLKDQIIGLEKLIADSIPKTKAPTNVPNNDSVTIQDEVAEFLSGQLLVKIEEDVQAESSREKSLLGKYDIEIKLENEQRKEKKWRKAIEGLEDQNNLLNQQLKTEKLKLSDAETKLAGYAQTATHLRQELANHQAARSNLTQELSSVDNDLAKIKTQLDNDLSAKGTIRIKLSTAAGPHDIANRAYIILNGKKLTPSGILRGLQIAFIDSKNGDLIFYDCFDTYASVVAMNEAASAIDRFQENDSLIVAITSTDESTWGGGGMGLWWSYFLPHNSLSSSLTSIGSHKFPSLRYRHLWYFIKGPGIDGEEFSQSCPSNEEHLTKAKEFTSTVPRDYVIAEYQQQKQHLEERRKDVLSRQETNVKSIRDCENELSKNQHSIDSTAEIKATSEKEINVLVLSVKNNEDLLKPFQQRLNACLKELEKLQEQQKNKPADASKEKSTLEENSQEVVAIEQLQATMKNKREQFQIIQEKLVLARLKVAQLVCPQGDFSAVPLVTAVLNQNLAMVEEVLTLGADVNATDEYGWTALHCAVAKASLANQDNAKQIIRLLLQYNARLDIQNSEGKLTYEVAVTPAIRQFLLDTALNTYARKDSHVNAQWALEGGANPNTFTAIALDPANSDGQNQWVGDKCRNPLMWAIISHKVNFELINLLCTYGADPTLENPYGWNAMRQAQHKEPEQAQKITDLLSKKIPELKHTTPSAEESPAGPSMKL